ncbi:M61 family metallopeptidase [Sphingobacterium sp. 2149]|uniref:M61 family metallopeptidase n=1 Tax=Sphingobacterium sp. 2149 TaxID=2817763 RepID=UPI001AE4C387|nr:M61 family metallopeptidase [Sphingobacterium sp. 2149]MDR6737330.1 putative metalloprotease with PDZ domain [Sphingobacterium sp. 2149]
MDSDHLNIPKIHFEVSFPEVQAHYIEVKMSVTNLNQPYVDLKMPVWSPGSYLIREYAKNVERFRSLDKTGNTITYQKISKNTWRIPTESLDQIEVVYAVYGFETSVRTNFFDSDHAFIVPTATFLYIDNWIDHPTTVSIDLKDTWTSISTGLEQIEEHKFYAPNFDILYDSPIEAGNQDIWKFQAAGVEHECAMVGGGSYDKARLTKDITRIVEEETRIWGSNPNKRYVIITHNYQSGGGGLEHLNSTVLGASRNAYLNETSYKNYLSLVAHEYFHLWNVKRLRPKALGPFNYDAENYTTGLWIMEGFTSYYDNLIIKRCGFYSEKEYLSLLANDFNIVLNRPGHAIQSAAASSFDTWIKYYRPDENSINSGISYYNKGAMLTALLDIKIIAATEGKLKLDDVIREAYEEFFLKLDRGFEENEFKSLAERIAGTSLDDIFDAAHQDGELDYNDYFNLVGYEIIDTNVNNNSLTLGITTNKVDGLISVATVEKDSGAYEAGLNVRDELIAINNNRLDVKDKEIDFIVQHAKEGELLNFLVARDGLVREIPVQIRKNTKKIYEIRPLKDQTFLQELLGKIWMA